MPVIVAITIATTALVLLFTIIGVNSFVYMCLIKSLFIKLRFSVEEVAISMTFMW
jgi:hypothetical protein